MTLRPLANPAGNADRLERPRVAHIQIVGIDQIARMLHLTAEADREPPHRRAETAPRFRHIARKADIAHPVRRLRQLPQEPPRRLEGAMHIPERAGPPEPRELQPRRRMALCDRARLIDPHEEERNPLGPRPLQGREAVTDLFDRGPEPMRQNLQIVPHLLCRRQKPAIGHHRRPREIIGQPDLGDRPRRLRLKPREIQRRLQQLILRHKCHLQQELKAAALGGRARRQRQNPGGAVVMAQSRRVRLDYRDAQPRKARAGQIRNGLSAAGFGKPLCGMIHRIYVIVAIMKEIAHLVPGACLVARILAPQRLVQARQPLVGLAIGAVQLQERPRQRRRIGGRQPQIGQRRRIVAKHRIGQRLAHVAHHPLGIARAQFGDVEAEFLRQRQNHRRAHGPVVVLHLVEIGQRHAQLAREILLRQAQSLPRLAQLGPGIEFLDCHGAHPLQLRMRARLHLQRCLDNPPPRAAPWTAPPQPLS